MSMELHPCLQGVAVRGVTANTFYGVADVYGQCEEVTIVPADDDEDGNGMVRDHS